VGHPKILGGGVAPSPPSNRCMCVCVENEWAGKRSTWKCVSRDVIADCVYIYMPAIPFAKRLGACTCAVYQGV
jgi:hypothetical protein